MFENYDSLSRKAYCSHRESRRCANEAQQVHARRPHGFSDYGDCTFDEAGGELSVSKSKSQWGDFAWGGSFLIVCGTALLVVRAVSGEFEAVGVISNGLFIVLGAAMLWKPLRDRARIKREQEDL